MGLAPVRLWGLRDPRAPVLQGATIPHAPQTHPCLRPPRPGGCVPEPPLDSCGEGPSVGPAAALAPSPRRALVTPGRISSFSPRATGCRAGLVTCRQPAGRARWKSAWTGRGPRAPPGHFDSSERSGCCPEPHGQGCRPGPAGPSWSLPCQQGLAAPAPLLRSWTGPLSPQLRPDGGVGGALPGTVLTQCAQGTHPSLGLKGSQSVFLGWTWPAWLRRGRDTALSLPRAAGRGGLPPPQG